MAPLWLLLGRIDAVKIWVQTTKTDWISKVVSDWYGPNVFWCDHTGKCGKVDLYIKLNVILFFCLYVSKRLALKPNVLLWPVSLS